MIKITKSLQLRFLSFVTVLLMANTSKAAEITAIDFTGKVIGQVISTGMVINVAGQRVGTITADSLIVGDTGAYIGGIVPQGIAIGFDNRLLGKIHADGVARTLSGKPVGHSLPNGLVIDDIGNVIGNVLYPGLIYSPDGNTIGRLTDGGDYTDLDGQKIGFVSANGYAYKKSGDDYFLEGRLMSSKMVVSNQGKFLGSIAPNGRLIDFEGKDVGNIRANGFAYNAAGKVIGSVISSGYAFDIGGRYMGVIGYNGEIKNGENILGFYRADGKIVNAKGEVSGFAVPLSATANDNKGQYLGYVVPNGWVYRGNEAVGVVGAKGYVYNKDKVRIGELVKTGPIYDSLAHIKGAAMKNGRVVGLGGNSIGYMRGSSAYDGNGTLIGGITDKMFAIDSGGNSMGIVNIDSSVINGSETAKLSPFGYVFNADGKVIGGAHELNPVYSLEGLLYSYITPNGEFYRLTSDVKLSQNGTVFNKEGYIGGILNPLYAVSFLGQPLGRPTEINLILNNDGAIAYKLTPGDYVVETNDPQSNAVAPIRGFSGDNKIALNIGGDLIGYADNEGKMLDLNGKEAGKIVFGNYIVDNNQVVSGQLVPFAAVVNEKCSVIGVVNGRGDIINNREVIIGRLLPNGQAISDVGSYIGYAVFEKNLIDFDGNFSGVVNTGIGYDLQGKSLGCVNRNGIIIDGENKQRYGVITPEPVINFDNQIIGHVLANGSVVDTNSQPLGYMQPNGNVVSKSKKTIGNVMKYKIAYDYDNKFLGLVQNSGQVVGKGGEIVGQINFDGSVINKGNMVGYALYDFYVYDENHVTYGYLTKDGTVLSMVGSRLGQMDRGFVLNRQNQVIARGDRDYIVRDASNNAVGMLYLDGNVIDFEGEKVGTLAEAGLIRNIDGDEIARATPLQYYVATEGAGPGNQNWADYKRVNIEGKESNQPTVTISESGKQVSGQFGNKVVGIALNPDGDVIGNIYDDNSVKNEQGSQIGFRTPDGMVVDMSYNPIGIEEVKNASAGEMFVPADAFGSGNAYGIGNKPSNLGPGGGYGQGERYDPARAAVLSGFQANRRRNVSVGNVKSNINVSNFTGYEEDGWPSQDRGISTWRVDMSEMILEDKAIPAVLARSVYASEGFSENIPITAIVERNIYAEEGRNIIIPAGSRVIGALAGDSSGGNSGGAVKIGISWKRLIRPDGSQFLFSNAQTADAQGRSGAIGYLDEQLLKRYSMPVLTSLLQSGMAFVMAAGGGSKTTSNGDTTTSSFSDAAQDARQNFLEQMNDIFAEILERKANIRAVTYVPAGTRIIIFPNQDLWLNSIKRSTGQKEDGKEIDGEQGLTTDHPEGHGDGSVAVRGNYRENVRPVSGPSNGTGRNAVGYVPPANGTGNTPPSTDGKKAYPSSGKTNPDDNLPELL